MKINTQLNKEAIANLYFENKEYALPLFAIIVSVLLFFVFIVPQATSFPSRKNEIDIETAKLNKIKESEKVLSSIDENLIDSQLKIVSKALPSNKAFQEVLNSISTAATLSNTQIENYQFQEDENALVDANKFPSLTFEVDVTGDVRQAIELINQLHKTYPISEVTNIINSGGVSTITILFYYKPFPSISFEDRGQIRNMSAKEKSTIDEISKWNDVDIQTTSEFIIDASASAELRSSPF